MGRFNRWEFAIVVARVVVNGPNCGAAYAMFVRVIYFQSKCPLVVKTYPLVVPDDLHSAGTSLNQIGRQIPCLGDAFDFAAT